MVALPQFKSASLTTNLDVLKEAKEAAEAALSDPAYEQDPTFPAMQSRVAALLEKQEYTLN